VASESWRESSTARIAARRMHGLARAFSSEVDAGSREENRSRQESGIRFFEAPHPFSLRLKMAAASVAVARDTPQRRHACAKLDSKTQHFSARLRCLMTNAASLLDKSKLFHKIFLSRLN
jgi:hypothetical protein